VREAYLQKQEGIDSQQKEIEREKENEIGIVLWQNFDLSKNQRFEAKNRDPSNLTHVLHRLEVGIIGFCFSHFIFSDFWFSQSLQDERERNKNKKKKRKKKKEKVKIKNNILMIYENIRGSCCGVYLYVVSKSNFIL
jgi:hypothetical protein